MFTSQFITQWFISNKHIEQSFSVPIWIDIDFIKAKRISNMTTFYNKGTNDILLLMQDVS